MTTVPRNVLGHSGYQKQNNTEAAANLSNELVVSLVVNIVTRMYAMDASLAWEWFLGHKPSQCEVRNIADRISHE